MCLLSNYQTCSPLSDCCSMSNVAIVLVINLRCQCIKGYMYVIQLQLTETVYKKTSNGVYTCMLIKSSFSLITMYSACTRHCFLKLINLNLEQL